MNDQSRRTEQRDPRVEAALRDYLDRIDRGDSVNHEEFLALHAPIADQLRSFIAAEDEVRKLAARATPRDPAHDSTKSFVAHAHETIVPQLAGRRGTDAGGAGLSGHFGRYRIIRALGKGAMGTVYLAEDTQIERLVALKTPHFNEDPTGAQTERFIREARAAGHLRHPHICPIYDFGQIEGRHFITMAYIEGRPLSEFIQPDNQQAERQVLLLVRKLASALQEAHDHGVVHRDLKPANIMVDKKGDPIIMDFGLAQQTRPNEDVRLTQTGNILGTPAFMSPEQVEGEPAKIGPPTDQYSLGVILYELLTGELPFRGTVMAVMGQILTKQPTAPGQLRPDLDPRIEAVCLKMMAKNPAERFRSLKAAADEISSILKSLAAKAPSNEKPALSPASSPPGDRTRADASASQVLKSLQQKTPVEKDLEPLEEQARKCYSRRDFDQVIEMIERVPEKRRNPALQGLLDKSRAKVDEIALLICDIEEAARANDAQIALEKAEALLKVKPGYHRALEIQEKYSGPGAGRAARVGVLDQFRRPLNDGGWIPWSALAFGLAVLGVVAGVLLIHLNGTAVLIDIQDPGVEVVVNGTSLTVTGPHQQSVKVTPGNQELTIRCAGLETVTKSFTIKRGEKRTVTVSILDSKLMASLDNEIATSARAQELGSREQRTASPSAGDKDASPSTPTHEESTTAALSPTFNNGLGMEFVLVPKGKSWLGGGGGKPGDKEVLIGRDFYLGKYEVTQEEWDKVMGLNPSRFSRTGRGKDVLKDIADAELKRCPIEHVSRDEAQAFLDRLNKQEKEAGWVYRLPREAEWEYACRGGPLSHRGESAYYFYFDKPTNELLPEQANFRSGKGLKRTCKVGSYRPNRLGLYDMHGNVFELCDDLETAAAGALLRVARGGGWSNVASRCRAAFRAVGSPSRRGGSWSFGLRVARVPVGGEIAVVQTPPDTLPDHAQEKKPVVAEASPQPVERTTSTLPPTFKNILGMEFVLVPKGKSWLGGGGGRPGEKEVTIEQDFYLGKYEVTQAEWATVTGHTRGFFHRGRPEVQNVPDAELARFPVEHVSWVDAQDFLERLNKEAKEAGWVYRLPKEAEWEYACRGGPLSDKVQSAYYFYFDKPTNELLPGQANFKSGKGLNRTCRVGSYQPNGLGLYDMHGNVWEWCDDADAKMEDGAHFRAMRGGGWYNPSKHCEAASRDTRQPWIPRHFKNDHGIGLRVARIRTTSPVATNPEEEEPADTAQGSSTDGSKADVATGSPKITGKPLLVRGEWRIENDELVQPTLAAGDEFFPILAFGEPTLSNYDLTLEAKKTGGQEALGILFHWLGPGHHRYFCLGGNRAGGNRGIDFGFHYDGKWGREDGYWKWMNYASNRWYSLKVEVRGDAFRAYLDGELQYEPPTDGRFTQGRICLYTDDTAARFRHIKITDPQGNVLFDGLPDLPPAGSSATPKAGTGNNPHLSAGEIAAKNEQRLCAERLKTPIDSTNSLGIKLALIPPGEFAMGSPVSEQRRWGTEQQHHVRITKPFYLGVYEVTQSEFEHVMERNPSKFSNNGGPAEAATGVDTSRNPVERVSWYDAIEFCNKLSEKEKRRPYYRIADVERDPEGWIKAANVSIDGGGGYRLPTEAEWEYACRAGTTTPFNFGTANNGTQCDCNGGLPYGTDERGPALGRTVTVGSYRPNAFGLYDMHGNVWERCWDIFEAAYYAHSPETDPGGPAQPPKVSGEKSKTKNKPASDQAAPARTPGRVIRGGCWRDPTACRAAARSWNPPDQKSDINGFRIAHNSEE
jgi:formylglycine-generating enzyme required for sulfatase activity/serine/threonine protein kinase